MSYTPTPWLQVPPSFQAVPAGGTPAASSGQDSGEPQPEAPAAKEEAQKLVDDLLRELASLQETRTVLEASETAYQERLEALARDNRRLREAEAFNRAGSRTQDEKLHESYERYNALVVEVAQLRTELRKQTGEATRLAAELAASTERENALEAQVSALRNQLQGHGEGEVRLREDLLVLGGGELSRGPADCNDLIFQVTYGKHAHISKQQHRCYRPAW